MLTHDELIQKALQTPITRAEVLRLEQAWNLCQRYASPRPHPLPLEGDEVEAEEMPSLT